jgi:hypothetical protein
VNVTWTETIELKKSSGNVYVNVTWTKPLNMKQSENVYVNVTCIETIEY